MSVPSVNEEERGRTIGDLNPIMPRPSNQAMKSLRDFITLFPGIARSSAPAPAQPPTPPLVLRVAAAGHLHVPSPASLQHALQEIFTRLQEYAWRINDRFSHSLNGSGQMAGPRQPELRVLCQLAPGVDQMAASAALELGYSLHAVLPGSRIAVEDNIRRHGSNAPISFRTREEADREDAVQVYRELLERASRVLELDPPTGPIDSRELTNESYAQAGSIILSHCDIVIVAIHEDGDDHAGGTKWIEQRTEDLNLPLIRVPIDRPSQATLIWTTEGRRETRALFNEVSEGLNSTVFDSALNQTLLNQSATPTPYTSGWFENRIINQLKPSFNSQLWDERWTLPATGTSLADHSLGSVTKQIDDDLKMVKVWADHRASALAIIVRGSFIFCAMLGSLAVFGAVVGLLQPGLGKPGKILEIACLTIILCFIRRSTRLNWRAQWLSLRQLERSIEQVAWLLTLGRVPPFAVPAHAHEFQDDEHNIWANWYLRSVLRAASFPNARLDADYIKTVHELASKNLVRNQISYFESEAAFYHRADERLDIYIKRCILLAFLVTFVYLTAPYMLSLVLHFDMPAELSNVLWTISAKMPTVASPVATALGALMPAIAAALSAIRSHGEYAQIAARYRGTSDALQQLEFQAVHMLTDRRRNRRGLPLRSGEVAELLLAATNSLFQEVVGWQSILRKKEIEPI